MTLNQNSFSARAYRWFYIKDTLPDNLCPYFWKQIFLYPLTFLLFPIILPSIIMELIDKERMYDWYDRVSRSISTYFAIIGGALCLSPILLFWHSMFEKNYSFIGLGLFLDTLLIVVLLVYLYREYKKKQRRKKGYAITEKKPNLIVEFVKAKYNKHCPKIVWRNKF